MPQVGAGQQVRWVWKTRAVDAKIRDVMNRRLRGVGKRGEKAAVKLISKPFRQGGVTGSVKQFTGGKGKKTLVKSTTTRYRPTRTGVPAPEGEPPRRDIAVLAGSVTSDVNETEMYVLIGTLKKYGFWLELGTRKMGARPWLRPMLNQMWPVFRKMLTKKIT